MSDFEIICSSTGLAMSPDGCFFTAVWDLHGAKWVAIQAHPTLQLASDATVREPGRLILPFVCCSDQTTIAPV